ncbi:hypothetical protein ACFYXQ_15900 [Nocardia jiangxiensis]|uniref:Uncharacterized protein n=1 Tax=Nocardia jiangxiensis TaxID=282685 RepID=A0ABW6S278_9NOCA
MTSASTGLLRGRPPVQSQWQATTVSPAAELDTSPHSFPSSPTPRPFYQDLLGFPWSDTIGDFFVFLRCDRNHHAANFMQSTKYTDVHHIAYETRGLTHRKTLLDHLAANNYSLEWGALNPALLDH